VTLAELPFRAMIIVRGDAGDGAFISAVRAAAGVELPVTPNTTARGSAVTALWLGPDEWLLTAAPGEERVLAAALRAGLAGLTAAVVDVSESRTVIAISGPKARDLIAKGCTLDLHPRIFAAGACAQTGLARTGALIHAVEDTPVFEITVVRSFADYLWVWLTDAAREYGVAVNSH
jgi:sarcosine oxidase subunit gamma